MRPGEVLFVPGGTPHAVENLTDSLAVAGNFVDESNLAAALTEMRWLALRDAEMGRVVASLVRYYGARVPAMRRAPSDLATCPCPCPCARPA